MSPLVASADQVRGISSVQVLSAQSPAIVGSLKPAYATYQAAKLGYEATGPQAFIDAFERPANLGVNDKAVIVPLFRGLPKLPEMELVNRGFNLIDKRAGYKVTVEIVDYDKKILKINGQAWQYNGKETFEEGLAKVQAILKQSGGQNISWLDRSWNYVIPEAHAFIIPLLIGAAVVALCRTLFGMGKPKEPEFGFAPSAAATSGAGDAHNAAAPAKPGEALAAPQIDPATGETRPESLEAARVKDEADAKAESDAIAKWCDGQKITPYARTFATDALAKGYPNSFVAKYAPLKITSKPDIVDGSFKVGLPLKLNYELKGNVITITKDDEVICKGTVDGKPLPVNEEDPWSGLTPDQQAKFEESKKVAAKEDKPSEYDLSKYDAEGIKGLLKLAQGTLDQCKKGSLAAYQEFSQSSKPESFKIGAQSEVCIERQGEHIARFEERLKELAANAAKPVTASQVKNAAPVPTPATEKPVVVNQPESWKQKLSAAVHKYSSISQVQDRMKVIKADIASNQKIVQTPYKFGYKSQSISTQHDKAKHEIARSNEELAQLEAKLKQLRGKGKQPDATAVKDKKSDDPTVIPYNVIIDG